MIKRYNHDYAYIHADADNECVVLPTPHATLFSRLTAFHTKTEIKVNCHPYKLPNHKSLSRYAEKGNRTLGPLRERFLRL